MRQTSIGENNETEVDKIETLVSAAHCLTEAIRLLANLNIVGGAAPPDLSHGLDFYREVIKFETALIVEALRVSEGSQVQAAALLRLNNSTLNCKIKKYKIDLKNGICATANSNTV